MNTFLPSSSFCQPIWLHDDVWPNPVCFDRDYCAFITFLTLWVIEEEVARRNGAECALRPHIGEQALKELSGRPRLGLLYRHRNNETISQFAVCCLHWPTSCLSFPLHLMTLCVICCFITSSHCDTCTVNHQYCQEIYDEMGETV